MRSLHGLDEVEVGEVLLHAHVDAGGLGVGGQRLHGGAQALDGCEEAALLALCLRSGAGEVGAAEHTQHHLAVLDQRQTNGVLLATQEAQRAVDGVHSPVPSLGSAPVLAVVDQAQHALLVDLAQVVVHLSRRQHVASRATEEKVRLPS